ncbi:MAG: GNAT family protein [Nitrolancea sp.]
MDRPIINIEGTSVALGPMNREIVPAYQSWINQFGTLRTLAIPPIPMTLEAETAWYESISSSSSMFVFTIYERETWLPIGNTSVSDVDYRNGTCSFGIVIGEPSARGKGYGTEATSLMLDYAFTALGLHNVMLAVYEFNLAAARVYEKVGFREIGRRRKSKFMGGKFWDEIFMDCLASEFESPVLAKVFAPDEPR